MDFYGFYTGEEFEAYNYLGAHCYEGGAVFRFTLPVDEFTPEDFAYED